MAICDPSEDAYAAFRRVLRKTHKRPTLTIALVNSTGTTLRHFALAGALPVRWTGPNVNSGSGSAATESLEIAHQGFI